jgi:hypothetical protein
MNGQQLFATLAMLAALPSFGYAQTNMRDCPNKSAFGVHPRGPISRSSEAQVEVTYFATDDPNVFISERAGIYRSASGIVLSTDEFVAKLGWLEKGGVARVQSRQSAASLLGEVVALNLEHVPVTSDGRVVSAAMSVSSQDQANLPDRETEISVTLNPRRDGGYYRLNLLSWFVDATPVKGGRKTVDYDASYLLKPGQTILIKLFSDFEVGRSGPSRKYIAVTLRSAGLARTESATRDR